MKNRFDRPVECGDCGKSVRYGDTEQVIGDPGHSGLVCEDCMDQRLES